MYKKFNFVRKYFLEKAFKYFKKTAFIIQDCISPCSCKQGWLSIADDYITCNY